MRILIFGATGRTGRELVAQALEGGHEVTAFVRDPNKLTLRGARLKITQGDIRLPETIRAAIPGQDAVLSALGVPSLGRTTMLSDAAQEIVRTMEAKGVRRILWESSLGVGETRGQLGPVYNRLLIPLLLRHIFADKQRQASILRASTLEW